MHHSGTSDEKPFPAVNGGGVAALDYDLDGQYDLCFLTGTDFPIDAAQATYRNHHYRNLGNWRFENVSASSGLDHAGFSAGVAVGDFDADGFPDVYLNCFGQDLLYWNLGDGTYQDVSKLAGIQNHAWGTSAAFLDYDDDGLLDVYACNYAEWSLETNRFCGDPVRGVRLFCNPRSVAPVPDVLYRNQGDGTFREASDEAGIAGTMGRGQGVAAADVNDDGRIDLYVGNDGHPNFLFLNAGDGRFVDATESSGAAYDGFGNAQAGMGVDVADIDADGRFDIFVTNYEKEYNTIYLNAGGGQFQDVSSARGVGTVSLPWVGWGTALCDFNLDGRPDMLVTNGHTDDNLHELGRDSQYLQPPHYFWNTGERFQLARSSDEGYFSEEHAGRGLAVADLDGDGDLDVVISHLDGPPALLKNTTRGTAADAPGFVRVRLIGTGGNRDAVGARVSVRSASGRSLWAVKGGSSYLSAHDLRLAISAPASVDLEIDWPGGKESVLSSVRPDRSYSVIEPLGSGEEAVVYVDKFSAGKGNSE